jgi:hypothetical protein
MKHPADDAEFALREALRKIIRPIVLGQLRACRYEHPQWLTKGSGFIASAEKRIVNDLISRGSTLRLMAALAAHLPVASLPDEAVVADCGSRRSGWVQLSLRAETVPSVFHHQV